MNNSPLRIYILYIYIINILGRQLHHSKNKLTNRIDSKNKPRYNPYQRKKFKSQAKIRIRNYISYSTDNISITRNIATWHYSLCLQAYHTQINYPPKHSSIFNIHRNFFNKTRISAVHKSPSQPLTTNDLVT